MLKSLINRIRVWAKVSDYIAIVHIPKDATEELIIQLYLRIITERPNFRKIIII